jgi:uncharacterized protein YcbX
VDNIPQQDSAERAFNKLARTFASQVEALNRHRGKGQQKVTVEHVHVHEGGQAIVGNVGPANERRIEMTLKLARFPFVRDLAGFDFAVQPSIDPKQVRELARPTARPARWSRGQFYVSQRGHFRVTLDRASAGVSVCGFKRLHYSGRLIAASFRRRISGMSVVGKVESLWRYPVKSMRGEGLEEAFVGFSGVYGDRLFAFRSSACPKGFPFLTGREQEEMLLYQPRFCHPGRAAKPSNLSEAESMAPGINPLFGDAADLAIEVETPSGEVLGVDDLALIGLLKKRTGDEHVLTLLRSERAMTDCRPISLFSIQTGRQLGDEIGTSIDKRRFRANIYMDLASAGGFAEDAYVGRTLRIGSKVAVLVLERDPRCKMITLDPDTAQPNPQLLRNVNQSHDNKAGVYGAVLVEGTIRRGDTIEIA